jgi:hypothetical protein
MPSLARNVGLFPNHAALQPRHGFLPSAALRTSTSCMLLPVDSQEQRHTITPRTVANRQLVAQTTGSCFGHTSGTHMSVRN